MKKENVTCIQRVKVVFPLHNYKIMDLLQTKHHDWFVYRTKKQLVMETTTFDINKVEEILTIYGFSEPDYLLEVEYERKWGML